MVVAAPSVPRPPFTVAVNLSLAQCRNGHLARTTGRALRASGLEPRWLELKVTGEPVLVSRQRSR